MASRLINVRLDPADQLIVARLRASGISVSEVLRRAVRAEAAAMDQAPLDAEGLIAEILAQHPTPPRLPRPRPDAADRAAVRKHIQARLRQRR